MINIIFWQNTLSPHQLPYITELAKQSQVGRVVYVVRQVVSEERKKMGWGDSIPEIQDLEIIVAPNNKATLEIFQQFQHNSYHFFANIRAFPFVFNAFKISLQFNVTRGLIVETPFFYSLPPYIYFIKTLLFDYKYYKYVSLVFALGERAVKWYRMWNPKWQVFEFSYSVELPNVYQHQASNIPKFVFAGSLIKLKNPQIILKALRKNSLPCELHFIGDGPLLQQLKKLSSIVHSNISVVFHGKKPMAEALSIMQQNDILILPSKYDGWGAVVNEALMAGLFVIVSNKCGAKALISPSQQQGLVFKSGSVKDLKNAIDFVFQNISNIQKNRNERIEWGKCLNGQSIAKYMVECIINPKTIAPWET